MTREIPLYQLAPDELLEFMTFQNDPPEEYCRPHRHNYFEIIWLTEGNGQHSIDLIQFPLHQELIYFIAPGQVHQWNRTREGQNYKCMVLKFGTEFLYLNRPGVDLVFLSGLFNPLNSTPYIQIPEEKIKSLLALGCLMEQEYHSREKDFPILYSLLTTFLLYAFRIAKLKMNIQTGISQQRTLQLLNLLNEHYKSEQKAGFYARKMNLSPKRLNEITRKMLGKTVTQLIHSRIFIEAKRDLIFGRRSIKEISYGLGFEDPTYFSRFFKKQSGISPTRFRKKNI